jgi:hypothetical protein
MRSATPSGALVRDYNNHPVRSVREQHGAVLNWLVWLAITCHERCIPAVVGLPVSARVVVPSLTSRPGVHPFTEIIRSMGALGRAVPLAAPEALCDRVVR